MQVSVTIIAKDAAKHLEACLESVQELTSDVNVVVDDRSTDATEDIARRHHSHVARRPFINFADQKNYALSLTKHNWVLSLDADETISPQLLAEIKALPQNPDYSGYKIPRVNYIFGRSIHHTNWSPASDTHVWLFDKTKSYWTSQVHEDVITSGKVSRLFHPKIHSNYQTVEQFLSKLNHYTSLEAQSDKFSWTAFIVRPFWARIILQPMWKFVRHYFLYLGFLDGWHGLYLSYLMAIYGAAVTVKAWQKQNSQ